MPSMQSQMELHPIVYISALCIVIFCALVAWILTTQAGRNWLARLEQRNKRLQEKNSTRKWPTLPLDPERTKAVMRELNIERVNSVFDSAVDSLKQVITDPAKLDDLLKKLEEDRKKALAKYN